MIPIFEQSRGNGIGYGREEFLERFDRILTVRTVPNSTVSFALIFYDLKDLAIKRVLQNQDIFIKLDRLTGDKLHIFYVHAPGSETGSFNQGVMARLEFNESVTLPGVLFFNFADSAASDLEYVELRSDQDVHAFQELHSIIADRLVKASSPRPPASLVGRAFRVARSGATFVAQETVKAAVRAGLSHLPF